MQNLVKHTLYLFLWITGLTAAMTLAGIGYAWFFSESKELPHLEWLIGSVIIEVVAVILMLAKKGMKYLPDTQTDKEPKDTLKFMESFISTGTSATVVSNRVSWLVGEDKLISILQSKIESLKQHSDLLDQIRKGNKTKSINTLKNHIQWNIDDISELIPQTN